MNKEEVFLKETEALHSLRTLEEIEKNPNISQRELSRSLGVALGITNALLKTLTRKGFIKIRGESNRTLTYHLTHAGVLAKSKLALKWTLNTVDYYRQTRLNIVDKLSVLVGQGFKNAVVYGEQELLEICVIVSQEVNLSIIAIVKEGKQDADKTLLNIPIIDVHELKNVDADVLIICASESSGFIEDYAVQIPSNMETRYLF